MDLSDEEPARRLRAARDTARSTPLPPNDHYTDSLGFQLFDAGVEWVRGLLYGLGVLAMVVIVVVMLVAG